ncbi:DUF222 domain-containing protein [Bdellovibrio sp. HCB185ZH]|uniref:DUF222 domain-containing protein n=1 Tax=Bdellovibrio sp. HCB185ZH TaxID=3394235 RepID=UPI0039A6FEC0
MNLKTLNKLELDQRIKTLAQKERELLHEILLTIQEIDSRRTFLELGFPSLFDYLVNGVGYSEGSAQRRIDAARLMREIPHVADKIQTGEIKLNQISLIQKASRVISKSQDRTVTAKEKSQLLETLCTKITFNRSSKLRHSLTYQFCRLLLILSKRMRVFELN